MDIKVNNNSIDIKGNIISVADFEIIKAHIESIKDQKNIIIRVHDSLVINSSLIGYLVKMINQEGLYIVLEAGNDTLVELLGDIGLSETFHVRKI